MDARLKELVRESLIRRAEILKIDISNCKSDIEIIDLIHKLESSQTLLENIKQSRSSSK